MSGIPCLQGKQVNGPSSSFSVEVATGTPAVEGCDMRESSDMGGADLGTGIFARLFGFDLLRKRMRWRKRKRMSE